MQKPVEGIVSLNVARFKKGGYRKKIAQKFTKTKQQHVTTNSDQKDPIYEIPLPIHDFSRFQMKTL